MRISVLRFRTVRTTRFSRRLVGKICDDRACLSPRPERSGLCRTSQRDDWRATAGGL